MLRFGRTVRPASHPNPRTMKNIKTSLLSAAVAGLLFGATSCKKEGPVAPEGNQPKGEAPKGAASKALPAALEVGKTKEKHACAKLNSCNGKGGCATGDNKCAGKNSCTGKGGCATVEHHTCAKLNECSKQGGCMGKAGKNECAKKGGCAVPVGKH
jgi:hypothetical protein